MERTEVTFYLRDPAYQTQVRDIVRRFLLPGQFRTDPAGEYAGWNLAVDMALPADIDAQQLLERIRTALAEDLPQAGEIRTADQLLAAELAS